MTSAIRKSVPLSSGDLELIAKIREQGSSERVAFEQITGAAPSNASEAQVIAELVSIGTRAIRDQALDDAYAQLADALASESEAVKEQKKTQRARRAARRGGAD